MDIWDIDASNGGGQLVRTALGIAAVRGLACRVTGIRAKRSRPGLARQHAAAAKAIAQASGGSISGAELGSQTVTLYPGQASGPLAMDIHIGTAGSTMLVLQALMPLLVIRGGEVRVHGGTDNPLAPPIDFTTHVLLPALQSTGIEVELELVRRGYYPKGGGEVVARAPGQAGWSGPQRTAWSGLARLAGVAYSSNLPLHVTERMREAALRAWKKAAPLDADSRAALRKLPTSIELRPDEPALSPGAGIVLWAEDHDGRRLSGSGLGEKGKPAERVGEEAAAFLLDAVATGAPCDPLLGDQLAVWAALADGPSAWRVAEVTDHLTSVLGLLADGLGVSWECHGDVIRRT